MMKRLIVLTLAATFALNDYITNKRIRFYFQYAHLNMYLFGGKGYKLMPQYPINPATFQMGLSWTFYN